MVNSTGYGMEQPHKPPSSYGCQWHHTACTAHNINIATNFKLTPDSGLWTSSLTLAAWVCSRSHISTISSNPYPPSQYPCDHRYFQVTLPHGPRTLLLQESSQWP